jgi:hypothetical protein
MDCMQVCNFLKAFAREVVEVLPVPDSTEAAARGNGQDDAAQLKKIL